MQTWPGRRLKGAPGHGHVAGALAGTFLRALQAPWREKVELVKVHALASSMPWRRRSGRGSGLWKLCPAFTQYIILLGRALLEPGRCRLHYQSPLTEELEELV